MLQINICVFIIFFTFGCVQSVPTLEVDVATGHHPISPDIYGMSYAETNFAKEVKLPFNRWGGDGTQRYNWKMDVANPGNDWFYENLPEKNDHPEKLPDGSKANRFIEDNHLSGARTMMTIPLIGWTSKDREKRCGFSVKKYGAQEKTDQWSPDCGNGVDKSGKKITGNDPYDTSVPINSTFVKEWVEYMVKKFGRADKGGVLHYEMDNEYDLWDETHRDIHPKPTGTDEIIRLTEEYGGVVKQVDPSAKILGPIGWNYMSLLHSGLDQRVTGGSDRKKHGDVYFAEWYLRQMKVYEDKNKKRLLDYFDNHYYPQSKDVFTELNDTVTNAMRLKCTRSLWDANYTDESWVKDIGNPDNKINYIPKMKKMIANNYPGTKVAITEYSWGGTQSLSGALAQADVFGIFGREGVDLAAFWGYGTKPTEPWAYAFRMFRNYDGKGSQFGDISIKSMSSDADKATIYGSMRSSDKALVLLVINKDQSQALDTKITIKGSTHSAKAKVFHYSAANLAKIVESPDVDINSAIKFPAFSMTLLVVPPK